MDVSTRSTPAIFASSARSVVAHLRQVSLPGPGPRQLENLARFHPADEVLERAFNGARIGPLSRKAHCFIQEILTKDKICPFHV